MSKITMSNINCNREINRDEKQYFCHANGNVYTETEKEEIKEEMELSEDEINFWFSVLK